MEFQFNSPLRFNFHTQIIRQHFNLRFKYFFPHVWCPAIMKPAPFTPSHETQQGHLQWRPANKHLPKAVRGDEKRDPTPVGNRLSTAHQMKFSALMRHRILTFL
jgi:hypothetical protein